MNDLYPDINAVIEADQHAQSLRVEALHMASHLNTNWTVIDFINNAAVIEQYIRDGKKSEGV